MTSLCKNHMQEFTGFGSLRLVNLTQNWLWLSIGSLNLQCGRRLLQLFGSLNPWSTRQILYNNACL